MKLIIAGSRDLIDYRLLAPLINKIVSDNDYRVSCVISGMARGADTLGEVWAWRNGVKVDKKPADWDKHGKAAGPIRNCEMGDIADIAIVFILDNSRGSTHMVNYMKKLRKPVHVIHFASPDFRLVKETAE